jgi:hypothetical protein
MADQKITDLTAIDALATGDLFAVVDDPAGTPASKKATINQVQDYIEAAANSFTAAQTITPTSDAPALTVRRNSDSQTSKVFQVQTEANAALADIDKDGKLSVVGATISGGTVTTSSPVIDAAQTWNAGGVTFTGLKFNATDTASAAASLLMDLQVGGVSKASIKKDGQITLPSSASANLAGSNLRFGGAATDPWIGSFGGGALWFGRGTTLMLYMPTTGLQLDSALSMQWSSGSVSQASDTFLTRRAAANLRLGAADAAAPVAQTLSAQSVVAGTTNTAGANLTITGSQGTGTGAGGSIIFQVAPAGSSGTAQNALATALTISSKKQLVVPSYTTFSNLQSGGGIVFESDVTIGSSGTNQFAIGDSTGATRFFVNVGAAGFVCLDSGHFLSWGSTAGQAYNAGDTRLYRDAANTLALRNGANAQTKRIYGTYTDASNYRRVAITMSTGGTAEIKPEGAGTGASGNVLHISGLPTSNPGAGILWNNGGTVEVGT